MSELGGRSENPTTVSFRRAGGFTGRALPRLPDGSGVTEHAGSVDILTKMPSEVLRLLLAWASGVGEHELPDLRVQQPTLEEIYLDLLRRNQKTETP